MFNNPMVLFFPSDLLKSYIHGHYRLNTKTGKRVWIESYQDKRPERNRAEFANWQHRIEHVKTHLAYGQHREAVHAFHDLNHADSKKLADDLGLTQHDEHHDDKKKLMEAVHARLAAKQKELSDKVVEQRRADLAKRRAESQKVAEAKANPGKPAQAVNEWGMIEPSADVTPLNAELRYKDIINARVAAVKFGSAKVTAGDREVKSAKTYKGYAIIRDRVGTTWQVCHINSGLLVIGGFASHEKAKIAAVRCGDVVDGTTFSSKEDFPLHTEAGERLIKLLEGMRHSNAGANPYAKPGMDNHYSVEQELPTDIPAGVLKQLKLLAHYGPRDYAQARRDHGNDDDYKGAVRSILEGKSPIDIASGGYGIDVSGIEGVVPKPAPKKTVLAKTAEQKMTALMRLAGDKDIRFYLNGVHIDDKHGRVEATNGFRMAVYADQAVASELAQKFQDPDSPAGTKLVVDRSGNRISGANRYPDMGRVTPTDKTLVETVPEVNAADLLASARGVLAVRKYVGDAYTRSMPVKVGDSTGYFDTKAMADMAETFSAMGYPKFTVRLHEFPGMLAAVSPDGKLTQVIMGAHSALQGHLFAPINLRS